MQYVAEPQNESASEIQHEMEAAVVTLADKWGPNYIK